MKTMTSREFNQDTSGAKRAANDGPVFITDRGRASHVLLSVEEYVKLADKGKSLADAFYTPGADDIDFEPPRLDDFGFKPVDFS